MVLGPLIANGLYEKSRRLETGEHASFASMVFVRPRSRLSGRVHGRNAARPVPVVVAGRGAGIRAVLRHRAVPGHGRDRADAVPDAHWLGHAASRKRRWRAVRGLLVRDQRLRGAYAASEEKTDALSALGISMAMVRSNLSIMLASGRHRAGAVSRVDRDRFQSGSSLCSPCSAMQPGTPTAPCAETIRMPSGHEDVRSTVVTAPAGPAQAVLDGQCRRLPSDRPLSAPPSSP